MQVDLTLNPRDFIRGLKLIETSTADVIDSLDDLDAVDVDLDTGPAERGLAGVADAAGDAEGAIDDLGSQAGSDLAKVERAAADAGREVETEIAGGADQAETAFASLARGAKADMAKVETSVQAVDRELGDVEDEANQSAKEFGSAFRGDPVEALEEVQSYLAEIISVKLPGFAGAAAAIAGGAALGLVVAGVEKWRERQERINEIATDFVGIIANDVDPALRSLGGAYDDLIDKQLTLAVLEEASAAQLADLATLAAARGETTQQYVQQILTGELSTQDELLRIGRERNTIADELLRITTDSNTANDDQIPILQAQDAALRDQGEALRAAGGYINENVAGYQRAKTAQDNVGKATAAAQEKQRALNRAAADHAGKLDDATREAGELGRQLGRTPDPSLRNMTGALDRAARDAERTKRAVETIPTSRTVTVTVREVGNRRLPV